MLVIIILFFLWTLNFFSLPGNWLMLGILFVFDLLSKNFSPTIWWWGGVLSLALFGEVLEWVGQYFGGKKYGISKKGNIGTFAGAIIGSILGMPFLFGVGALVGGLFGAYGGAFLVEYISGRDVSLAREAAKGALIGKILGIISKLSAGIAILAMTYFTIG